MPKYNSDFAEFVPMDINTPEGSKKMKEIIHYIMWARTRKPEKEPRIIVNYDEHGMFSKPVINKYRVLALVPDERERKEKKYLWFVRKFAGEYLKKDCEGVISYAALRSFNVEMDYNAIVLIMDESAVLPKGMEMKDSRFGQDVKGRPIFAFESATVKNMSVMPDAERDAFAMNRMRYVWKQYEDYNKSRPVIMQPVSEKISSIQAHVCQNG